MEIKVVKEVNNQLLGRKEVHFIAGHLRASTPLRFDVRKALSERLASRLEATYVIKLKTKTGTHTTDGLCFIYEDTEKAKALVHKHVYLRNLHPEERAKLKEEKPKAG